MSSWSVWQWVLFAWLTSPFGALALLWLAAKAADLISYHSYTRQGITHLEEWLHDHQ